MAFKFERLAGALATAWKEGSTIPLPQKGEAPSTRAEAYAVQDRMAELIGARMAGWKVGATVKAVQQFEGHDGPVPGRIFADRLYHGEARVPARLYNGAKIEAEFAMRLTGPLPEKVNAESLARVLDFHPAIELAATRYAPGTGNRGMTTFDGIADNGSGGAAVIGAAVKDWQRLPFTTMVIEATIDGSPPIQAYGGVYRRHPLDIAVETVSDLIARGISVEEGSVLLTGSLTLPTPIRRGQRSTVLFAGLPPLSIALE
jgi:2-keto-4-pentenoate hydratase